MIWSIGLEPKSTSVAEYLTTGMVKTDRAKFAKAIKVHARNHAMYEEILCRRTAKVLLVIPSKEEWIVIMEGLRGEIGHWNLADTYKIVTDRFWWPRMQPNIAHFVRHCDPFQKANLPEQIGPYGKIPINVSFYTWPIDFAGRLKERKVGNKIICGGRYAMLARCLHNRYRDVQQSRIHHVCIRTDMLDIRKLGTHLQLWRQQV